MRHKSTIKFFGYNKVTLPGDCHVAALLAMTEYFVRNRIRVCLLERNIKNLHAFFIILRATHLCHCERSVAISRKGHHITKPTQDTFVLAWRKRRKQA